MVDNPSIMIHETYDMFGRAAMEGVARGEMTKIKWTMFRNKLSEGSVMGKERQCVLPMPFKVLMFFTFQIGNQGGDECYLPSFPSLNLLNIQMRVWYTLFHSTPPISFPFHYQSFPFIIYKTPKYRVKAYTNVYTNQCLRFLELIHWAFKRIMIYPSKILS